MVTMRPGAGIEQQPVPAPGRIVTIAQRRFASTSAAWRGPFRRSRAATATSNSRSSTVTYTCSRRPVTGLDAGDESEGDAFPVEWEDSSDEQYAWTLGAGFSDPTPLHRFEEDVRRASAVHQKRVFDDTGVPRARNHILRFINGYPYVRGPRDVREDEVTERQRAHGAARPAVCRARRELLRGGDRAGDAGRARPARGVPARPANESLSSRLEFLEAALATYGHVMGDLHWRMAGAGGAQTSSRWPATFSELTGEPEMDSGVLVQAIANKTTRMTSRLRGLARIVQADDEIRRAFRDGAYERLDTPPLRGRPSVRRFRARLRALLRDYGRRNGRSYGSSTTFETPTWNLDHRVPLDAVATYAEQDLDELDRLELEARRERQQATRRFRGALAPDRDRRGRFDLALRQAQDHVRSMENHNHLMEQGVAGVMREAVWWMGEALVRRDRLDAPDDAMHLSLEELREAASDQQGGDLRPLVRRRVAELERRSQLSPPRRLGGGERSRPAGPPSGLETPPEHAGLDGTLLRGEPASRGRYTGRARVFTPGGERPDIERGDILVARNAGQDWTPILPLLGGIVLDEGAFFQHAALIAREYRVPCVLQTREATTAIADGQRITIDGGAGVVELRPGAGA